MQDLHTHTYYSDGACSPEEMVVSAIEKGLSCIGFSDHSYTDFDGSFCIPEDKVEAYRQAVVACKEKYKDKIQVLCGMEQDFYASLPAIGYDYVIGVMHYVKAGEHYIPVDNTAQHIIDGTEKYFGGDIYALLEKYYEDVALLARDEAVDIVGHFDVVSKFNEPKPLFDIHNPRYVAAWQRAAEALIAAGKTFEINTGAMARGYRTTPYPHPEIINFILDRGGKLCLGSDSHHAETIAFRFENYAHLCK